MAHTLEEIEENEKSWFYYGVKEYKSVGMYRSMECKIEMLAHNDLKGTYT